MLYEVITQRARLTARGLEIETTLARACRRGLHRIAREELRERPLALECKIQPPAAKTATDVSRPAANAPLEHIEGPMKDPRVRVV